jgi:hypothetical protein
MDLRMDLRVDLRMDLRIDLSMDLTGDARLAMVGGRVHLHPRAEHDLLQVFSRPTAVFSPFSRHLDRVLQPRGI